VHLQNKTGKVAPEHRRLSRYTTMELDDIMALPVASITAPTAHLLPLVSECAVPEGIAVLKAWGFNSKSILSAQSAEGWRPRWPRGWVLFSQCTELILFGVRGKNARTLALGGDK